MCCHSRCVSQGVANDKQQKSCDMSYYCADTDQGVLFRLANSASNSASDSLLRSCTLLLLPLHVAAAFGCTAVSADARAAATGNCPPHAACSDIARFSSISGSTCLACSSLTGCSSTPSLLLLLMLAVSLLVSVRRMGLGVGRRLVACLISSKPSSCSNVPLISCETSTTSRIVG
eukprot:GHRR01017463.1.p2 GENE.GHRR01017463.1~~GHRR01017463.1.p2  ORF type:complete len:175 (-),score=11.94 GHRR01017463.1:793-1317(-)